MGPVGQGSHSSPRAAPGRRRSCDTVGSSLTRPVRLSGTTCSQTWLLTYRPALYAGLQVFLHCLLNRGTLVLPEPGMQVDQLIDLMRRSRVTHVSATPSFCRRLITLGCPSALEELPLEQLTLGGEVSDQLLLDMLRRRFPVTRISHIYATSELGRCFSVRDGRAGFPRAYLRGLTDEGVSLRLEEGELLVRSANSMRGPALLEGEVERKTDWVATGDLVEEVGDRCYFIGRLSELINVGGNKVQPLRVEELVQSVPGVREARVFARPSSLVGQMVACEFVVEPGCDANLVKQEIQQECLLRLAPHERPRFLDTVPSIALSAAGKKIRTSG